MFCDLVKGKRVLFITTRNIDYIRNSQEKNLLEKNAESVEFIYSTKHSYPLRLLEIYGNIVIEKVKGLFHKGKIYNCNVVFIGFAPQLVLPVFKIFFHKKSIIIDFFISVYDTMICDRQKFRDGGVVSKICKFFDEITLRFADHIITDTKAQAGFFIEELGAAPRKVETLYLEADEKIYYPRPQLKTGDLKDKFVVLYFGSILPLQGVDVVLDTIRKLKGEEDIFFDIIGPIPESLKKPIQSNVCYTDWLSQEELAERIANADLCLAGHFHGSIAKADRTIPGKAYIYEAMKKKMILGNSSANRELFKEDEMHSFVTMGDSDEMCRLLLEYINKNESEQSKIAY